MNEDMSQFLGVFLDEANEQMELLETNILLLEQEASQELLQVIFRAAHTLKGSSRAMGFTSMGELTHAMEDVFDKLRNDELTVNRELIDALFVGLDSLKAMLLEISASGSTELDTSVETTRLRNVLNAESEDKSENAAAAASPAIEAVLPQTAAGTFTSTSKLSETARVSVHDALSNGCRVYTLKVNIAQDCMMKSVRALMVLQQLESVGSILATTPDEEKLENEEFEHDFQVVFATQGLIDAAVAIGNRITEVRGIEYMPWPEDDETRAAVRSGEQSRPAAAPPADERDKEVQDRRNVNLGAAVRDTPAEDPAKGTQEKKAAPQPSHPAAQTVRVEVTRLDKLLNLVGELVIDRTRIAQLGTRFEQEYEFNPLVEHLNETSSHIGRITDELQEEIMKARMLPIDNVFNRFPRMIRDLAQKLGKEINFVVEGRETELDRSVIEVIGDPLIHMLRNSVDHGVEMPDERIAAGKSAIGTVLLRASHEENHIVIEIVDDGKGIDPEKMRANAVKKGSMTLEAANRLTDNEAIHLIFASGFSTATEVTDVSGRGVGMDIVKSNLQKLGAHIEISSKVGHGTTFTVKLPLTLAIIRGLLVTVSGCVYALPLASVVETIKIEESAVHLVNHREVILQRGKTLPLVRLRSIFQLEAPTTPAERAMERMDQRSSSKSSGSSSSISPSQADLEKMESLLSIDSMENESKHLFLVVVGLAEKQVGLVVDSLLCEQEVVIKTLGKFIGDIKGISGATILGDGHVALIVDVNGLISIASEEKGKSYAA